MKKRNLLALLLALLLAVPLGNAFSEEPRFIQPLINRTPGRIVADSLDDMPEAARARGLNTLAIGVNDLWGETNPFFARTSADEAVTSLLYDELVFADNGERVGAGVATFEQTADGYGYTFTVRENVFYADGTPVRSDDFINALYLLLMPGFDGAYDITRLGIRGVKAYLSGESASVSGITRQSERAFTVRLDSVGPDSLFYFTIPALRLSLFGDMRRPDDMIDPVSFANFYGEALARMRATDATEMTYGQYTLTSLRAGEGATFTKNAAYWRGAPRIETVELVELPTDNNRMFDALLAGRVDIVSLVASQHIADTAMELDFINLETWEGDVVGYLGMDLQSEFFSEVSVRQALAMGVDRDSLRLEAFFVYAKSPTLLLFDEYGLTADTLQEAYPYDAQRAANLLDNAGWLLGEDGFRHRRGHVFRFTLSYNQPNPYMEIAAPRIQSAYKALGIDVVLEPLPLAELTDKIENGQCEMYFQARRLPANMALSANLFVGESPLNTGGYDSETAAWFLQNATAATEAERRTVYYETLFRQVYVDLPMIPLYRRSEMLLINGRVMNAMVTTSHSILSDIYRLFLVEALREDQ